MSVSVFYPYRIPFLLVLLLGLSACETPGSATNRPPGVPSSQPLGVNIPTAAPDYGPRAALDVSHIPVPVPRMEPRSKASNVSPYTVKGKTYHVMQNPKGFRQKGIASWYGYKFHGKVTANGELYNMYAVTAAHKTLPIPSFARVTNLNNNRSIVVRINDRGPFHDNRIIDLSYTAAQKLGYIEQGTAPVAIEHIDPATFYAAHPDALDNTTAFKTRGRPAPLPFHSGGYELPAGTYLQMGAFSQAQGAKQLQKRLTSLLQPALSQVNKSARKRAQRASIVVVKPRQVRLYRDNLYRVQIGPIANAFDMEKIKKAIKGAGLSEPNMINRNG